MPGTPGSASSPIRRPTCTAAEPRAGTGRRIEQAGPRCVEGGGSNVTSRVRLTWSSPCEGEDETMVVPRRLLPRSRRFIQQAADLEDVPEAGGQLEMQRQRCVTGAVVVDLQRVSESREVAVQLSGPADGQAILADRAAMADPDLGVRQFDDRRPAGLGGGRQRLGHDPGDPDLVPAQESRVVMVETEPVLSVDGDLTVRRTQEEGVAILDHDSVADASDLRGL